MADQDPESDAALDAALERMTRMEAELVDLRIREQEVQKAVKSHEELVKELRGQIERLEREAGAAPVRVAGSQQRRAEAAETRELRGRVVDLRTRLAALQDELDRPVSPAAWWKRIAFAAVAMMVGVVIGWFVQRPLFRADDAPEAPIRVR